MNEKSSETPLDYNRGMFYRKGKDEPYCPSCYLDNNSRIIPMKKKTDSAGRLFYECTHEECSTSVFP